MKKHILTRYIYVAIWSFNWPLAYGHLIGHSTPSWYFPILIRHHMYVRLHKNLYFLVKKNQWKIVHRHEETDFVDGLLV